MKKLLPLLILLTFTGPLLLAQMDIRPPFTPAVERIKSFEQRKALEENSILNGVEFRSVGPTVFSGRVSDVAVNPEDPSHFYVGYSSGGLWYTHNNGVSFEPLFDDQIVMTIGDIAVDWQRDVIWLGSGEVNSSRSSYSGVGMFKSTDKGKTWQHMGLAESHHIGRIILHPNDPSTLWVAVLGHLYSPNQERGVYKTTDGGKSWNRELFVNDNAGGIDLVIDPDNPDILYAATWERERSAWNFIESGTGSGIYKSTDGGDNWTLMTKKDGAFPSGAGAGRIGLDLVKKDGKSILYATIDNYDRRPKEEEEDTDALTKNDLRTMSKEDFLGLKKYQIEDYLQQNRFPEEYKVEKVISMIKSDEIKPATLVEYTEDANSLLFDTPVVGLEVFRSEDEGENWSKTHEGYLDNVYNSYGYYFGQIRVDPNDSDLIYILGVPVIRSKDGGKTFESIDAANVHSDHHALWINPDRPGHIILGNDGGINISYDYGETWQHCNTPPVGQFYYIAVDMDQPYNVYGGLQDNGVWYGPSTYEASSRWYSSGNYPYERIMGGDGMQVAVDTRDNNTVITGFQFGNYFRLNTKTGRRAYITPRPKLGERPLRWNWQTPVQLSVHNQDILYMGSNKLHRSFDQGDNFEEISGDLTKGGQRGDVPFGTLATIHESPLKFGLIYTGSDDGLVHVTRDGGFSWKNISAGLPENRWVSRIIASSFDEGTVYAVLNGYRWDNFEALLYRSRDYGETWEQLGLDLPLEPLNVVKEDPSNRNILYVGSDHGLYVSLDAGKSFMLMNNGLPAVAVHDVVIHPRDKDIVVGTHGRSIYIGRGKELQQLDDEIIAKALHVFKTSPLRYRGSWGQQFSPWREASTPSVTIPVYANTPGKIMLTVETKDGMKLQEMEMEANKGLNYLSYDLSMMESQLEAYNEMLNKDTKKDAKPIKIKVADNGKAYLYKGKYNMILKMGQAEEKTGLTIK